MIAALRTGLVLLCPALLAAHTIDAADVWIQLAAGRWIAAHGLPQFDPFSAPPAPAWLVHDWLAALAFTATHALAGAAALVCLAVAACTVAVGFPIWVAGRTGWARGPFEVAALVACFIAYERFFVRPELFTFVLAVVWVQALARGWPRRGRELALLAILQCLWANLHAAFVLGPCCALLAVAADVLESRRRTGQWQAPPRLRAALPLVAIAASCVHAYGPRILAHVIDAASNTEAAVLRRGIVEWQPTFSRSAAADPVVWMFVASLGVALVLAWQQRRHVPLFELGAVASSAFLATTSRRHLALYALVALPLVAAWAARAIPATSQRRRLHAAGSIGVAIVAAIFALDVARGWFYARFGPPRQFGFAVSAADHALGAIDFVERHDLEGPLFNNIAAGSLLLARTGTTLPVWVDGRLLDLHRFTGYRRALESPAEFESLARARSMQLVILALQPHPPVRLVRHLATSPAWRLVFLDGEGAVFVRAGIRPDLPAIALDRPLPQASVGPSASFWRRCDPGEAGRRGLVLHALGFASAARDDLRRARIHCSQDPAIAAAIAGTEFR